MLEFDAPEMFYDESCQINVVNIFEYSSNVKNPYHELHRDLFVRKTHKVKYLFESFFSDDCDEEDKEDLIPYHISKKIRNEKHGKIHKKFFSYCQEREEEFFADMDKTWKKGEMKSYAFIDNIEELFDIMGVYY